MLAITGRWIGRLRPIAWLFGWTMSRSPILSGTVSRRRSFLNAAIKASEAAARQHAVAERRQAAAAVRSVRERERDTRRRAVNDRAQTAPHGEQQVDSLNTDLADQIEELSSLLSAGLAAPSREAGRYLSAVGAGSAIPSLPGTSGVISGSRFSVEKSSTRAASTSSCLGRNAPTLRRRLSLSDTSFTMFRNMPSARPLDRRP